MASACACTQVSLEPPPCDELTTYDPRRSATRVSPPGSTQLPCLPVRMNGRRSIRRGSMRRSSGTQVGQVDCLGQTSTDRVDVTDNGFDGPGGGKVILDVHSGVGEIHVEREA